jgi:hypothetical protein
MYSKLSEKCKKCRHVDNCDDKRMEACAVMEVMSKPTNIASNISTPLTMQIAAPVLRDASAQAAEQIKKELYKDLYKHLNICDFAT